MASDTKASVAVGSKNEYDLLISNPPQSLRANLYIMLIDIGSWKITKEEKLCQY